MDLQLLSKRSVLGSLLLFYQWHIFLFITVAPTHSNQPRANITHRQNYSYLSSHLV